MGFVGIIVSLTKGLGHRDSPYGFPALLWLPMGLNSPIESEFLFPYFIFLVLSLRKFTGSYCIVFTHVYINLLRNTRSRSSRKWFAGKISQWFWCKYFAHNFILYFNCSKKIIPKLGNSTGNPGVSQANPYLYLWNAPPMNTGGGFCGYGSWVFHFCYCRIIMSRDISKSHLCQVIVSYLC